MQTMTYEVDGRIARITLNRPERGNGITLDMPVELKQCVGIPDNFHLGLSSRHRESQAPAVYRRLPERKG